MNADPAGSEFRIMTTLLVVGDVHIKLDNLLEIRCLIEKLERTIHAHRPDFVVLLGDVLHTHERVHTNCLNQAAELFRMTSSKCPTFVLVGNHDFISNSQFLTEHHWMNPFKQWPGLTIVDRVVGHEHAGNRFVLSPYVPDGRFREALATLGASGEAHMILAHQTFDGAKMGAVVVSGVEVWPPEMPFLCSGHIHDRQRIQPNLYYAGTPMPHAFGERNDKTVSLFSLRDGTIERHTEINLEVCSKRIEYLSLQEAKRFVFEPRPHHLLRLTIKATGEEARAFKRSEKYRELVSAGVKVVLDDSERAAPVARDRKSFEEWLWESVRTEPEVARWYRYFTGSSPADPEIYLESE